MDVTYLKNFVQSFNSAYLQKLITNVTEIFYKIYNNCFCIPPMLLSPNC